MIEAIVGSKIMNLIKQAFNDHLTVMAQVEPLLPTIELIAQTALKALKNGGKIFFMGNGGSAADAQHLAAELIGRFKEERHALPAIALTTDSSVLTCLSNDYDYSIVFARQIEALCRPEDVVIGISTSGKSPNVLKGIAAAKKIGAMTIGFSGNYGAELSKAADICISVPSKITARIQEAHLFIGHTVCEWIEQAIVTKITSTDSALAEEPI